MLRLQVREEIVKGAGLEGDALNYDLTTMENEPLAVGFMPLLSCVAPSRDPSSSSVMAMVKLYAVDGEPFSTAEDVSLSSPARLTGEGLVNLSQRRSCMCS